MDRTGFWDNVVARPVGKKYQLAYGHHRLVAFREKYGDDADITLIVRDLSESDMLRIMADENMAEFGTSAAVEQETIRAVVLAYAEGKIELKKPPMNDGGLSSLRNAPSFLKAKERFKDVKSLPKPYNAESIARFLGWMSGDQVSPRVRNALAVLEAAEEAATVTEDPEVIEEFEEVSKDLSSDQARQLTESYKVLKRTHEGQGQSASTSVRAALKDTKKIADRIRNGDEKLTIRQVREEASKARAKILKRDPILPSVESFCRKLAVDLYPLLGPKDKNWSKLNEVVKYREQIDSESKNEVVVSLRQVSARCLAMVDAIEGNRPKLMP